MKMIFLTGIGFLVPFLSFAQVTKFTYDSKGNMTKTGGTFLCPVTSFSPIEEVAVAPIDNGFEKSTGLGDKQWKVYPNPTKGDLQVEFSFDSEKQLTVEILNSIGQVMLSQQLGRNQSGLQRFDLSRYPQGNYFVRLIGESGKSTLQKIVLQ
jgi:hypothetical protein